MPSPTPPSSCTTSERRPAVYLAPVYLAPVYPAPVYLAPVYLAPVYLAPVYLAPRSLGAFRATRWPACRPLLGCLVDWARSGPHAGPLVAH